MRDLPGVSLRPAVEADCRHIWEWRNEPVARASSFDTNEIAFETHQLWFSRRLENTATRLYVAVDPGGVDMGYVRFDLAEGDATMNVCLDRAARGRGFGTAVILESVLMLLREGAVRKVIALIKAENGVSLAAFKAAGFTVDGCERRRGADVWVLHFASNRAEGADA